TTDVRPVLAGASALISWFLIFAPNTEYHYFFYLAPLWGYYVAECRSGWLGRLAAFVIIGGTIIPSVWFARYEGFGHDLPAWLQCHQLWAAMVALVFGVIRLYQYPASRPSTPGQL